MKKLTTIAIILSIIAIIISGEIAFMKSNSSNNNVGGAINVNYYKTATNTSVVCSGATSTLILAEAGRPDTRNGFGLTVASSTSITLCKKASGCTIGNGWTLNGSGGSIEQTWDSAYYGAYSCIGNDGASSTIGVIYNQTQ